jgi:hypothetical protein
MALFVCGVEHGSELQNGEGLAVTAHALLQEENGTRHVSHPAREMAREPIFLLAVKRE